MADQQDKTEDPTSKRLEDARKKGQLARSRELSTALVLVASGIMFLLLGGTIAKAIFGMMEDMFTLSRDETYDMTHMFNAWAQGFSAVAGPVLLYMIVAMAAGIYGSIALGGYNFTWQSASPKLNKLNPLNGFKRMFGMNGLVELLKAIAKFFVIATIALLTLMYYEDEALHLDVELYPNNLFHALDMLEWAFLFLTLGMIPIAALDVPYQMYKHNKEMKMSAARRMMQQVPEADVIVTNPTHYSVALKYDDNGGRAPVVVAKGIEELAMHIRKIGDAHDVPIVPSPMLTRAIYYSTEVAHEIPHKLFMAVAQVLAYVYQLRAFKAGKGKRPKPLKKDLPIPPELRR